MVKWLSSESINSGAIYKGVPTAPDIENCIDRDKTSAKQRERPKSQILG